MLRRLVVGGLVLAAVEVGLVVLVARAVGALVALVLLFGVSLLGSSLLRRVAAASAARIATDLGLRGPADRAAAAGEARTGGSRAGESGVLLAAAALVAVPGFLTDVVGLTLLAPPVRRWLLAGLGRWARRRARRGRGPVIDLPPGWWSG